VYREFDRFRFTLPYVASDKNAKISAMAIARRNELGLSLRDVADASEKAVSHSQLANLENEYSSWLAARHSVIQGIERGLNWREGYLWDLIHGKKIELASSSTESNLIDVTDQYVNYKIVLLSYDGNEIGERTMLVKKEHAGGKLFGFPNHHATVHGISIGQTVLIKSQKTFKTDDMVLVVAGGQHILAYASNEKASKVTTAQNMELRTEKVIGLVVDFVSSPEMFRKPRSN
jgi:transcriptional regulator with XRE-family HTH domain